VVLLGGVGLALGWRPSWSLAAVVMALVLLLLGTAAFSGLGLLLAGTLRAEATLAVANLVHLLFLGAGAVVVPLDRFPSGVASALHYTPLAALTEGLRDVFHAGVAMPWTSVWVLAAWALVAVAAAGRFFRWE
jgi:ABC-2 type transport system permease protein